MKTMLKLTVVLATASSLGACSWLFGSDSTFRDRSNDYRKASVEAPIQLPEGIESDTLGDGFAIPPISDRISLDDNFEIPKPDPLSEDTGSDSVRINTLDKQRWILVDGAPGQIWPRLRGFLNLNQLSVQRADANSGILETSWLQPSGENLSRERYRISIDQGVQRGTSEIYVLQADSTAGEDRWPEFSSSDERAKLMTTGLAQYLADSTAAAAVSMLAQQALDSSGKITLEENDKAQAFIRLQLPFTRAWASVGRSLEKSGYLIDDLNRTEQIYYVHFQEKKQQKQEKQEKGFFSRMFSWGSNDDEATAKGIPYLVKVTKLNDREVAISIERQSGKAMTKNETDLRLKQIKRNIA